MIKMLSSIAGVDSLGNSFSIAPGYTTDVFPSAEEKRLIAAGLAEAVTVKKVSKKKASKKVK